MTVWEITLAAYDSRNPAAGTVRVRVYVTCYDQAGALAALGRTAVYARRSDGVVTRNGGLGADRTAHVYPEWETLGTRRVDGKPEGIGRRLDTGGVVAGIIIT